MYVEAVEVTHLLEGAVTMRALELHIAFVYHSRTPGASTPARSARCHLLRFTDTSLVPFPGSRFSEIALSLYHFMA